MRLRGRTILSVTAVTLAWLAWASGSAAGDGVVLDAALYKRAEQLSPQNINKLAYDLDVRPTWIHGRDALWFRTTDAAGTMFRLAEPARRRTRPAFDHDRMATALSRALGIPVTPNALPITDLLYPKGLTGAVRVMASGKTFDCDLDALECTPSASPNRTEAFSPQGRYAVFAKGSDLWVRDLQSGVERSLTTDGAPQHAYGAMAAGFAAVSSARLGLVGPPVGDFSPDGSKFITYQLDESHVEPVHLLQNIPEDGSIRPKIWSYRSPLHAGPPATGALLIFDLTNGKATRLAFPPSDVPRNWPGAFDQLAWSADGRGVYFVDYSRDLLEKSLYRADVDTGAVTRLITEHASTGQPTSNVPKFKRLKTGEILWASERDGYSHLYLYGGDGRLKRQLTHGDWVVRDIVRVDEQARTVDVLVGGLHADQDPYLRHLCRVSLDGGGLKELTPEDADHEIETPAPGAPLQRGGATYGGYADDGRWFVDAYSRVDLPTTTVLRDREGRKVMTLATARLTDLGRAVYTAPEPFRVLAEDGRTPLYGIVMKPKGFDRGGRYPVIDSEYDGPQAAVAPKRYLWDVLTGFHSSRAMAELGFIVVDMDARGKPWRSRAFWDYGYGRLGRGGLPDRVSMLQQLAAERPYMDLARVGVYGYSAGGFAAVHAIMDRPDVFKVGVAVSPYALMYQGWNWGQSFQGDPAQDLAQEPWNNAANFKGKLFMMVGDVDDIVHPASVMRIADALMKNNKSFDMLIVPNGDHQMIQRPYLQQRVWDYFVRNLLGSEPPPGYVAGEASKSSASDRMGAPAK
jgi:dipeptidyl aminopeptidase/acylaminoacyl peptidase